MTEGILLLPRMAASPCHKRLGESPDDFAPHPIADALKATTFKLTSMAFKSKRLAAAL
jgi:hypothetical protein